MQYTDKLISKYEDKIKILLDKVGLRKLTTYRLYSAKLTQGYTLIKQEIHLKIGKRWIQAIVIKLTVGSYANACYF